ncbi:MAG: MFS transporter [Dehalococcoidia bacterium]
MPQPPATRVPALIRRNTLLIAASQAFVGTGTQVIPAVGAVVMERVFSAVVLAALPTSLLGISRTLVAYPTGKISDAYGRKPGLLAGLGLALLGTVLVGVAILWASMVAFLVGVLLFGMGIGAAQQLRVAAADMYPPSRRAEGLGYVLTGSLVGALGGPVLITLATALATRWSVDELAVPWLLIPAVVVPSMFLVLLVRPDPKEIAGNLERYYPGEIRTAPPPADVVQPTFATFVRHYPKRTAFMTSFALQGAMVMVMALTSLTLSHHGHDLPAISLSVSIHVIGMFGFSLPLGRLADRLGRRPVMLSGLAITAAGGFLVGFTEGYGLITAGTFLVGVGWSCGNIATTALLADTTTPAERGRAIGVNDTFSSASGIGLPLIGSVIASQWGIGLVGLLTVALMVPPAVMLLRLREVRPGEYDVVPAPLPVRTHERPPRATPPNTEVHGTPTVRADDGRGVG